MRLSEQEFVHGDWMNDHADSFALILRGLPGAGKSTLVEKLRAAHPELIVRVASADAHRIVNGVYQWQPNHDAHFAANQDFIEACRSPNVDVAVIDNTNVELIHVAPYITIAAAYGRKPYVVNIACYPETSLARNQHNVPERSVRRWHQRLGQIVLPKEWPRIDLGPLANGVPVGQD